MKSLNHLEQAKISFEELLTLLSGDKNSTEYISTLIDYGNLLDDLKLDSKLIERTYKDAYELAKIN